MYYYYYYYYYIYGLFSSDRTKGKTVEKTQVTLVRGL
jgi:hypothetical protein